MKTPEQQKQYRHEYYLNHLEYYQVKNKKYAVDNPEKMEEHAKQFHIRHPHYERDLSRKRKAVTEPLIFQFLDNGFSSEIGGYVSYLRAKGVLEKHIRWFMVDVQKHLRF